LKVCLANDSFPPIIDGVANTIKNYAQIIHRTENKVIVATPAYPSEKDHQYAFPIVRYPSVPLGEAIGYRAGYPFSLKAMEKLGNFNPDIIHSHCPYVSTFLSRELRNISGAPVVFTYHTKFDIDIMTLVKQKLIADSVLKVLVNNISATDEVWVVSKGAGDNLKSIGFKGEYRVMSNGVDIPRLPENKEITSKLRLDYNVPEDIPVFLSVGRIKWYKGHKITLDALKLLKDAGFDFRMLIVGSGSDEDDIKKYAKSIGVMNKCIFTGAILDREVLRNVYFLSDLFVFPSTYDTNGIVVREAAACNVASIVVKDSCASEDIADMRNGLLIEENPQSLYSCLKNACENREKMKEIGVNAGNEIYISWEDSVSRAMKRYEEIIRASKNGELPVRKMQIDDAGIKMISDFYQALDKVKSLIE